MKALFFLITTTLAAAALASGELDDTFGDTGRAYVKHDTKVRFESVDLQARPNGSIIVVTSQLTSVESDNPYFGLAVFEVLPDGKRNTSFGEGGIYEIRRRRPFAAVGSVLLEDDKLVLAARERCDGDTFRVCGSLLRLSREGRIDRKFGDAGTTMIADFSPSSIARGANGALWVAGFNAKLGVFGLVRLTAEGRIDTSLRLDQFAVEPVLAVAPDGKLLVAGSVRRADEFDTILLRLDETGAADHSFGVEGRVVLDFAEWNGKSVSGDQATALAFDNSGRIYVAGRFGSPATSSFVGANSILTRLSAQGEVDASFGQKGSVTMIARELAGTSAVRSVLIDQAQRVFVAAGVDSGGSEPSDQVYLWLHRFQPDGKTDTSFGWRGSLKLDANERPKTRGTISELSVARLQRDGKLLVGASVFSSTAARDFVPLIPVVVRLLP